jgi:hypothetical protein
MAPKYSSGDWLLVSWGSFNLKERLPAGRKSLLGGYVTLGDIVVIERSEQPGVNFVKRINQIDLATGQIWLLSDNPDGVDSRQWGALPLLAIKAKVISRVRRGARSKKPLAGEGFLQ